MCFAIFFFLFLSIRRGKKRKMIDLRNVDYACVLLAVNLNITDGTFLSKLLLFRKSCLFHCQFQTSCCTWESLAKYRSIAVDVADFRCFFTVLPCLYQSRLVNKTLKRFFLTCMKNYITCAMYCYFFNLCI